MTLLPKVKLKCIPTFPSTVYGGTGIETTKENGAVVIDMDWSEFGLQSSIPTSHTNNVLTFDTATNSYIMIPSSLLGGAVAGISEANNDGVQYGRQSLGWTPITIPPNNFIQAGTGAVTRTMQDKARDIVSVKDFGAVGNGIADDTNAINLAIAAASSVYLPAGQYKTTSTISVAAKSLRLMGAGQGVTKIMCGHSGDCISLQISNTSTINMLVEVGDFDVVQASGGSGGTAISIVGSQDYPNWQGETQFFLHNVRVCSTVAQNASIEKWNIGLRVKNIGNPRIVNYTGHQLGNKTGIAIVIDNDNNTGGFVTFGLSIDKPLINGWSAGIEITGSLEGINITPYEIVTDLYAILIDNSNGPGGHGNVVQINGGDMAANGSVILVKNVNNFILNGVDIYQYNGGTTPSDVVQLTSVNQLQIYGNKIGTVAPSHASNNLLGIISSSNGTVFGNSFIGDSNTGAIVVSSSSDIIISGNACVANAGGPQAYYIANTTRVTLTGNTDRGWTNQYVTASNINFSNVNNLHY